ncbi:hypothetical protein EJF36_06215 [Bacillus sp. HMF5848]|uniref:competence protein CoiA n=1 Tax=Bacillus sp. HMF5848 TaxID=2495421 RepID=UPI000F77000F|nr:competence protein CoiA family protein [Bacillus sp. HMF5848]RSK26487.1 hypothetical protein EJF36_06215 [Bacillus sp. HMF5848]
MFTASLADGTLINLLQNNYSKEVLERLRNNDSFFCPDCKSPVMLKLGERKIHHFAHYQSANCSIGHEPETADHMAGKKLLYDWLCQQKLNPQVEHYISSIKQRADVFVEWKGWKIAFEYQCSTISPSLLNSRTTSYVQAGYTPVWILSHKKANFKSFSKFQWSFICDFINKHGVLLSLDTNMKSLYVTRPTPIATKQVISSQKRLQLSSTTSLTTCQRVISEVQPIITYKQWLSIKNKNRSMIFRFIDKKKYALFQNLYLAHIPPPCFPVEAGWPVRAMHWIEQPCYMWQLWILLDNIIQKKSDLIFLNDILKNFYKRVQMNHISLRTLPLVKHSKPEDAIEHYVQLLIEVGVLEEAGDYSYKIVRELLYPSHENEALDCDVKMARELIAHT